MDDDTRRAFERRDKIGMWLGGLALSVSLTFGSCALERAFTANAEVALAETKNREQDQALDRGRETREKVIEIEQRIRAVESGLGEIKDGQKEQRVILDEIRREVRKP